MMCWHGSVGRLAMLQGSVRLPTGLTVGKGNRAAVNETAVLFRAFPNREAHTRFFPVDGTEPGGVETLGRRIGRCLGFGFTFRLRLQLALTRGIRRVGPRSGAIATVSAFAVAFAAARWARWGLGRTRSGL